MALSIYGSRIGDDIFSSDFDPFNGYAISSEVERESSAATQAWRSARFEATALDPTKDYSLLSYSTDYAASHFSHQSRGSRATADGGSRSDHQRSLSPRKDPILESDPEHTRHYRRRTPPPQSMLYDSREDIKKAKINSEKGARDKKADARSWNSNSKIEYQGSLRVRIQGRNSQMKIPKSDKCGCENETCSRCESVRLTAEVSRQFQQNDR